jgi:hypothetical protein
MNDDEIRELFREMREEAVPADSVVRVRMAVAAGTQRSRAWRWWIPLLIAACCGMALLFFRPVAVPVPVVPPLPPAPVVADREAPLPPDLPAPKMRRVVHRVRQVPPPSQVPGTVVRIETNDPDVVILLVSD